MKWVPSVRLLTRFDNEVSINLALSMNFILWDIVTTLLLSSLSSFISSISVGTEKVLYVPVFPRRLTFH